MSLTDRCIMARYFHLTKQWELFAEMYRAVIRELALSHSPSSHSLLTRVWPRSARPVSLYLNHRKREGILIGHDLEPWYG
jgi:hypothetical protein